MKLWRELIWKYGLKSKKLVKSGRVRSMEGSVDDQIAFSTDYQILSPIRNRGLNNLGYIDSGIIVRYNIIIK